MQLAAFNNNNFALGHAAMMVNEGLPMYVISQLERRYDLSRLSVGISAWLRASLTTLGLA
jgi:UDP-N-acetyl-D-mannosaminuronic acid dehydrogenase